MAVWLGTSKKWGQVFLIGLGLDLAAGGRLGLSSLKFLIVAAGAYLISERLKWQRGQGEIKLKVE